MISLLITRRVTPPRGTLCIPPVAASRTLPRITRDRGWLKAAHTEADTRMYQSREGHTIGGTSSMRARVRIRRGRLPHDKAHTGATAVAPRQRCMDDHPVASSLRNRPDDRRILLMLAWLPMLSAFLLERLFDSQCGTAICRSLARLRNAGLVGAIRPPLDPGCSPQRFYLADLGLAELNARRMTLLAVQQGLSLSREIKCHGLIGGGPDEPVGARQTLLANLAHTLGTDGRFVDLDRIARQLRARETNDTILEWQNGPAFGGRQLRPDGYGRYYRDGSVYDFYVEYDRATMWAKGRVHKFQAYYAYSARQRFYRNVYHFPRVLLVTVSDAAEQRIARVVGSVAVSQYAPLPLLLTRQWRIDTTNNPLGLLGPIRREPGSDVDDRRC